MFTASPGASGPSEERRSVSAITSARKPPSPGSTAVRHTPLTATESPALSCPASAVATSMRAPSPSGSTALTVPVASTRPVNTSPLREPRADQHVVADLLDVVGERPARGADELEAGALDRAPRLTASGDDGGHDHAHLVDLAGVEERARQVRAALEQERLHVARAQLVERRADTRRLVLAGHGDHLGAGRRERLGARARGRARA